jgi:hypothetical protein
LSRRIPLVSDRPTIIFGADVTHPHPGEDSSPSIAAVSAVLVAVITGQKCAQSDLEVSLLNSYYTVPFPGCCFARLARGHEIRWTSECASPSPGADTGSFQSMAGPAEKDGNWRHDKVRSALRR